MKNTDTAEVNARLLNVARIFCSTEESFHIGGVNIAKHPERGVLLVATDGHRLMVIHDEAGKCRKPITVKVDRDFRTVLDKRGKDEAATVTVGRDGVARAGDFQSAASVLIDGEFPKWTAIVEDLRRKIATKQFAFASFSAAYLASFKEAANRLSPESRGCASVRIIPVSDCESALVLFPRCTIAFCLLMPMHADVQHGIPVWMKPVLTSKAKRAA